MREREEIQPFVSAAARLAGNTRLPLISALEANDSAVKILGDEVLKAITIEPVETVKKNTSIDWTVRESVQAKMRIAIKKILKKHGYLPDMAPKAIETVLEQAKLMADQEIEPEKLPDGR